MEFEELEYIIKEIYGSGDRYVDHYDLPEQLELVEDDGWEDEGKYQHGSYIVKCDQGNHFRISQSRSGSYYSDYYYTEPEVQQVKPRVVVISKVIWDAV